MEDAMNKHVVLLSLLWIVVPVVSAVAHHGYAEYDRGSMVTLEGAVKKVVWANPHVTLTLDTDKQGEYSVEWGSVAQLTQQGMYTAAIKAGDHVAVTGAVNKNPEKRIITLLREIRRPSDGWRWVDPRYQPSK
jgi:hypothetical protein